MLKIVKDKAFYVSVGAIAIPVIAQTLITTGVNMMDTLMLTSCGEAQLSASSLANQFISLFQIMCMGLGFGATVLTSQYWGAKDRESIKSISTIMLRICVLVSLLFSVASLVFPTYIMRIYTPETEVIYEGVRYLRISAYTYLFNGLSLTVTAVLRSTHQVRLPLFTSILTFFVNVFINWVFIFGKFGMPRMEIEGAAIGTLVARIVEFIIIVGYYTLVDEAVGYRPKDLLRPCRAYLHRYLVYCIPVLISDTLLGLGNNMVSVVVGHISVPFISAYAVVSQVTRMTTVFTQGMSNSACVLIGNTLGRGRRREAYEQGVTFLLLALAVGLLASCIIGFLRPLIAYHCNLSADASAIANELMLAVMVTVVFSAVQSVLTKGVLRGGGDTRFLMIADILFLWLVSVPLGYLTGIQMGATAFVVYIALHADWIIKSVWCARRLLQGRWINQTTAE